MLEPEVALGTGLLRQLARIGIGKYRRQHGKLRNQLRVPVDFPLEGSQHKGVCGADSPDGGNDRERPRARGRKRAPVGRRGGWHFCEALYQHRHVFEDRSREPGVLARAERFTARNVRPGAGRLQPHELRAFRTLLVPADAVDTQYFAHPAELGVESGNDLPRGQADDARGGSRYGPLQEIDLAQRVFGAPAPRKLHPQPGHQQSFQHQEDQEHRIYGHLPDAAVQPGSISQGRNGRAAARNRDQHRSSKQQNAGGGQEKREPVQSGQREEASWPGNKSQRVWPWHHFMLALTELCKPARNNLSAPVPGMPPQTLVIRRSFIANRNRSELVFSSNSSMILYL